MELLNQIEFWHNKASDTKFVWFPFYFLKPDPKVSIRWPLKFRMIICFGLYYGIFAALRSRVFGQVDLVEVGLKDIFYATVIFTIWFSLITAPLWNMRAKRMNQKITHQRKGNL